MDTIESTGNIDIFPVVGWEEFLGSRSDLVSIPHKVAFECEKEQSRRLLRLVYKRYPILVVDEYPNSGVRDMKGNIHTRSHIFEFNLSNYGGMISIENLKSIKNIEVISKGIKIADPNRFFYMFLHITMRKFLVWTQQHYSANKIYFDSDIKCFPDVAIDLGFQIRNRALRGAYGSEGWHAVTNIEEAKKQNECPIPEFNPMTDT
jgi:hypothetical protein